MNPAGFFFAANFMQKSLLLLHFFKVNIGDFGIGGRA